MNTKLCFIWNLFPFCVYEFTCFMFQNIFNLYYAPFLFDFFVSDYLVIFWVGLFSSLIDSDTFLTLDMNYFSYHYIIVFNFLLLGSKNFFM